MSVETLSPVLLTYFLAGLVKGAMGFGLPIVAIALLPLFVPVDTALALNAIVVIATNVNQIVQGGRYREGALVAWPLVLGMLIAIPPTAILAAGLSADTLLLIVGVAVLIFIAISLLNPALEVPQAWRRSAGVGFGLIGGVVGALTSAPAAALAPYMIALHLPRPVYITALGFLLTGFGVIVGVSYASVDILDASHVLPALVSVPIAIVGMWIGDRWARRLANETFRRAVLALLAVLAVMLIRRSLG
ncbi:MAG: sulfite exporter TauE/SafE family protein [Pseudomonadota bacterium]